MLELGNATVFPAMLVPSLSADGQDRLTVVVRGTFTIEPAGRRLVLAERQTPLVLADEHLGEPGLSSVRLEADTAPWKPGTDVVMLGRAHSPRGRAVQLDVKLGVGPLRKTVRVHGDRRWARRLGAWRISSPEPFTSMPLTWERAFGGIDDSDGDPQKRRGEARNPVGTGYAARRRAARLQDLPLPNLEQPAEPIGSWRDRPAPAGFGFVGRSWQPRLARAGTYDEAWQEDRAPLLPADFDEAYFQGAPDDQVVPGHLKGDEPVRLQGVSPAGVLEFALPGVRPSVRAEIAGAWSDHPTVLDTVVLEPDDLRVTLVWRALIPCARRLLYVDQVRIGEVQA